MHFREALVEAELDDPVVLRSFPRASLSRPGTCEGGHRACAYEQALGTGDATPLHMSVSRPLHLTFLLGLLVVWL